MSNFGIAGKVGLNLQVGGHVGSGKVSLGSQVGGHLGIKLPASGRVGKAEPAAPIAKVIRPSQSIAAAAGVVLGGAHKTVSPEQGGYPSTKGQPRETAHIQVGPGIDLHDMIEQIVQRKPSLHDLIDQVLHRDGSKS